MCVIALCEHSATGGGIVVRGAVIPVPFYQIKRKFSTENEIYGNFGVNRFGPAEKKKINK